MSADAVRDELLHGDDPWLRARRRIAAIAGLLAAEFAVVGMRQYGAIRRLPDVPSRRFDSNAVTTSHAAYPLGIPDAGLAVAGCGALIALATARGSARTGRPRALDVLLGAGIVTGVATAAAYLAVMLRGKKLCAYCLASTAGFFSLVPVAIAGLSRARRA